MCTLLCGLHARLECILYLLLILFILVRFHDLEEVTVVLPSRVKPTWWEMWGVKTNF